MEITKVNFSEKLGEIIDAIQQASFVAIDTEFTGLLTDDRLKRSYFDSGCDIYAKDRENLKNVTICQIGISAISSCIDRNGYEAKSYNFYIMPKALLSVDPSITCQSSSVEFLMQAGFDFRKWLLNGIPCLKEDDEQTIRKEFKGMLSDDYNQHLPLLVLDQLSIVDAWRQKASDGDHEPLSVFLRLPSFILHFLAAIYRRYTDVTVSMDIDEVKICYVGKGGSREKLLAVITSCFESIISENQGFVNVFKELTKDKVILLHNGMTDLTLMFKQFHRNLPVSYREFKSELHELFPDIFDTKRLAKVISQQYKKHNISKKMRNFFSNSSLEAVKLEVDNCNYIQHKPIVSHSPLTTKYNGAKFYYHEAGYDAFCTAYCFVNLAHIIQILQDEGNGIGPKPLSSMEHKGAVEPWRNEVPLMNSGISYVVIGGDNPSMNSMNWIVVQRRKMFSPLTPSQLNKLLAPFGQFEGQRLNNGSFLVASFRKKSILEAFRNHDFVRVSQYSPMQHSSCLRGITWSAVAVSSGLSVWLMAQAIKILQMEVI